jgi:hypothetical protein
MKNSPVAVPSNALVKVKNMENENWNNNNNNFHNTNYGL